ncbi:centrosomal protein of 68 kDa isoform X1 [Lates japonicus]|uniref:Centrosomal protein of 68 kDa isoform X1 n=1 Tax=Lates japonicus TaxID=270547 RepID=A0AAD3NGZ8_LATJO|nr:centrosomal protein of 68 kDa isoform X1 [Lates japonicus]
MSPYPDKLLEPVPSHKLCLHLQTGTQQTGTQTGGVPDFAGLHHQLRPRQVVSGASEFKETSSANRPAGLRVDWTTFVAPPTCQGCTPNEQCRADQESHSWQLEELQLLSRQVREVTVQLSRPVTASWESLEPGTTSILSSITLPEKQEAKDEEKEDDSQDTKDGEMGREERNTAQMAAGHRDSEAVRRISGAWVEPVRGGLSQSSLREVEALVEQLHDLTLPGSQGSSQEHQKQSDSLIQHIQVFCSHLGQLIQQLHTVLEKMELLAAPTVDIDGVKSSLAEYHSFQVEVNSHQPLTSSVLHSGQLLLSCINTTSPLLRDTLLMIERQSEALQTYTEHLFSSNLFAMDNLTQPSKPSQPSPVKQSREEDLRPVGAQESTL